MDWGNVIIADGLSADTGGYGPEDFCDLSGTANRSYIADEQPCDNLQRRAHQHQLYRGQHIDVNRRRRPLGVRRGIGYSGC